MKVLAWLLFLGALAGLAYALLRWRRRWAERQKAAEERFASLMAQVRPQTAPLLAPVPASAPMAAAPQERLLLDAAGKAGEAGEPALSIQLYAKLLSRYPQSTFAAQARAAVAEQKKRLAKA